MTIKVTRGKSVADNKALEALSIFLEDHKVDDVDVEPRAEGEGFNITANYRGKRKYSSWGKTVREAVTNMVRSITK